MNEPKTNEEKLSQLYSELKIKFYETKRESQEEVARLKALLGSQQKKSFTTPMAAGTQDTNFPDTGNNQYLIETIAALTAELAAFKNPGQSTNTDSMSAKIAILEKANKAHKDKLAKRKVDIIELQRRVSETELLLLNKNNPHHPHLNKLNELINDQDEDCEQLIAWKVAFAELRKHYEEAVLIARRLMQEQIWARQAPKDSNG